MGHLHGSLALAAALAPAVAAQGEQDSGGPLDAERACYDVLRYDLALTIDPEAKALVGSNTIAGFLNFASDKLRVDLDHRLSVDAVRLNGDRARITRRGDYFTVDSSELPSGAHFELSIDYSGEPREAVRAPWDGGFVWSTTDSGAPWIATACQGEGADLWWPCKDHPSDEADSMGIDVTVPAGLVVATNGRRAGVETDEAAGTTTWRWEVTTPINNYGVALNIAPYVELTHDYTSVTGEPFPFHFWVLPEDEAKGRAILAEFADHMRQMEEQCGPYPFRADKYGVAQTPHLGMEHQTIIAYGNQFRGDPNFDYDWLHHHELAHEWWGNLVTARDWNDFWIHEGIGTYVQALYLERNFGARAYQRKMALDARRIAHSGPVAPRSSKTTGWMYLGDRKRESPGGDIYFKGSWVCHELRWLLGDETFFEVLRRWAYPDPALESVTDGSQCRLATTDELLAIAERVADRELDWFFEVALRRAAPAELRVERSGDRATLRWETPDGLPYPMPVELDLDGRRLRVEVPAEGAVVETGGGNLTVDPDNWLLGAS